MKKFYGVLFVLLILVGCNSFANQSQGSKVYVTCYGESSNIKGASKELIFTGDETTIESLAMMISIDFLQGNSVSKEELKIIEKDIKEKKSSAMSIDVMVEEDFGSIYYLIEPFSAASQSDLELVEIQLEDGVCSDGACITMENMKRLNESQGLKCSVSVDDGDLD